MSHAALCADAAGHARLYAPAAVFGPASVSTDTVRAATRGRAEDPSETLDVVFGDLDSSAKGLTGREATRRLTIDGPSTPLTSRRSSTPRRMIAPTPEARRRIWLVDLQA